MFILIKSAIKTSRTRLMLWCNQIYMYTSNNIPSVIILYMYVQCIRKRIWEPVKFRSIHPCNVMYVFISIKYYNMMNNWPADHIASSGIRVHRRKSTRPFPFRWNLLCWRDSGGSAATAGNINTIALQIVLLATMIIISIIRRK